MPDRRHGSVSLRSPRLSAWRVLSYYRDGGLTDDVLMALAGSTALRARRWLVKQGYLCRGPIRTLPDGARAVCWRMAR